MQKVNRFSKELFLEGMWWTSTRKKLSNISRNQKIEYEIDNRFQEAIKDQKIRRKKMKTTCLEETHYQYS
jgi:hypothetical protein